MSNPHWIKIGTEKGHKFMCSVCKGECLCITTGCATKYQSRNVCDYKYCPRCGIAMVLDSSTMLVKVEKKI